MSRTSRLFVLLDTLRGHRRPVTATRLAGELSVSLRTIYRDIGTLVELGAPIEGEAGIGYVLRAGFFGAPRLWTFINFLLTEHQVLRLLCIRARCNLATVRSISLNGECT